MDDWLQPDDSDHAPLSPGFCSKCLDIALEYVSMCALIMTDEPMTYNRRDDDTLALLQLDNVSDFVDRLRWLIEDAQYEEQERLEDE